MCDFSLKAVKSRPAKVGDKIITHNFGYGTTGFRDVDSPETMGEAVAVCVMPGTEIAFGGNIKTRACGGLFGGKNEFAHAVAVFRQVDRDTTHTHHDSLEMPDGQVVKLTLLEEGQTATVLQLPAEPKNEAEADEQRRLEVVA